MVLACVFLALSLLCVIAGLCLYYLNRRRYLQRGRMLILTVALLLAILMVNIAVVLRTGALHVLPGVLIETMQVFSLNVGPEALDEAQSFFLSPGFSLALRIYIAVLYTLAPIFGGAVIYDVIAGVSPSLKMLTRKRRVLHVFSELNERSIILAEALVKSTAEARPRRRLAVVFTDVYVDAGEETESELLVRAKTLNAVCFRKDILHCDYFRRAGECNFYLMDAAQGDDFDDVSTLTTLNALLPTCPDETEDVRWNRKRACNIFAFSNHADTIESIRSVKAAFDGLNDGGLPCGRVRIAVIRDFAQTAYRLMESVPLYRPLIAAGDPRRTGQKDLRVVIFGNNSFSREMFKTVFWCGQMLNTRLFLTVVCPRRGPDTGGAEFKDYLNQLSPEILESCLRSQAKPACLKLGTEDGYAPPYCGLSFIEADTTGGDLCEFLKEPRTCRGLDETYTLMDCDYFLVMTGSDRDNIRLTARLRNALDLLKLTGVQERSNPGPQVIAYAVRSDDLLQVSARQFAPRVLPLMPAADADVSSPLTVGFGSLMARYGWDTVMMREKEELVSSNDLYNGWSDLTRKKHLPSVLYSASLLLEDEQGRGFVDDEGELERRRVRQALAERLDGDGRCLRYEEYGALADALAWLEHRRWNAFLRTQGFRRPFADVAAVFDAVNSGVRPGAAGHIYARKNISARLHPCLVEERPETGRLNRDWSFDAMGAVGQWRAVADGAEQTGGLFSGWKRIVESDYCIGDFLDTEEDGAS
ncbi:MAG: hypothetical protein IKD96_08025 [Oscillospiraceae bacterium]|nr:hypothetical protein [Oscillospiraceae bacterium]